MYPPVPNVERPTVMPALSNDRMLSGNDNSTRAKDGRGAAEVNMVDRARLRSVKERMKFMVEEACGFYIMITWIENSF
uniref:Uncharacterized protein n=1 Tax=Melanopsichium pennsylvanicum 4 TaxID=1398559 RepID=A0A077QYV3_9BASI|nr:uncharacterized protein BN887_06035 [Melanopsichium pennsylvanicum 4]